MKNEIKLRCNRRISALELIFWCFHSDDPPEEKHCKHHIHNYCSPQNPWRETLLTAKKKNPTQKYFHQVHSLRFHTAGSPLRAVTPHKLWRTPGRLDGFNPTTSKSALLRQNQAQNNPAKRKEKKKQGSRSWALTPGLLTEHVCLCFDSLITSKTSQRHIPSLLTEHQTFILIQPDFHLLTVVSLIIRFSFHLEVLNLLEFIKYNSEVIVSLNNFQNKIKKTLLSK